MVPSQAHSTEEDDLDTNSSALIGAVSVAEAGRRIGIGHSTAKELCKSGALRSFTVGRRRLVSHDAIADYIRKQGARG